MNIELFTNISNISYAFIIAGLIVVLLTTNTKSPGAVIGTISGYALSLCAVLLLTGLTYTNLTTNKFVPTFSKILSTLVPFIMLLVIFGLSLAVVSSFYDKIANNRVTKYYGVFSSISVVFIIMQVILFYNSIKEPEFNLNGYIKPLTVSKLLLLGIINIIVIITLAITLKFYSTDG